MRVFFIRSDVVEEILTFENVKKYLTPQGVVRAIDGISFSVKKGNFGLIGESGSGKSTLAYTVSGIYRPTEGKIVFNKQDISGEYRSVRSF